MQYSDLTTKLREMLDANGIEWIDVSMEREDPFEAGKVFHMERTQWGELNEKIGRLAISVIWGYWESSNGYRRGITHGFPEYLELWDTGADGTSPVAISLDEIAERYDLEA